MTDILTTLVELLGPLPGFTKLVIGKGSWAVKREEVGRPFFCVVLTGGFYLTSPGVETVELSAGDFVLLPFTHAFETHSLDRGPSPGRASTPVQVEPGTYRVGDATGEPDMSHLIGYGEFASDDAELLASLLPPIIHVRGDRRLATLLRLIDDETGAARPARASVLTRLLELLMIEALRASDGAEAPPGLLRGLADERLSPALRAMHERPGDPWSVAALAREAGLSRSAFFERFGRVLQLAPMEYLLHWRMLLAKRRLREASVADVADEVGYSSPTTFSAAFSRYAGLPPGAYQRQWRSREAPPAVPN